MTAQPLPPPGSPPASSAPSWLWTWPLRAGLGAVIGWVAAEVGASRRAGGWVPVAAGLLLAAVATLAPTLLAVSRGRGLAPGLALGSLVGLYAGVPETEHLIGVSVAVAVIMVGHWAGQTEESWPIVLAMSALVVWSAVFGGSFRNGALFAGLASLGLLVLAPIATRLPGPGRIIPDELVVPLLIAAQVVYTVALGRLVGLRDGAVEGAAVVALAAGLLIVVARVVVGPRR